MSHPENQVEAAIQRACPVCEKTTSDPFLTKQGMQLVRCRGCSMVYTNPVPVQMATGEFYDRAGEEYLSPEKLQSDYADVRFERELRLFRRHCSGGSVLDVGCSSGAFLYQLQKRFPGQYQILGTDVSQAPLAHAAKMGVPVSRGEFLEQSFTQKFDAVTFWAVMEHLAAPDLFLKKASEILKPGGHCFILTPNLKSLAVRLIGSKYRYIFKEHLNYFTPRTLETFAASKFSVIDVKSTHFNPVVIWQDARGDGREISRADRIKLLKRTTGYKQSRWMWPVKVGYRSAETLLSVLKMADNVAVVGRKK